MPTMLCDRPHARVVDFARERFIVATARGLNIGGAHLEMGDLIPEGAVSAEALRMEYEIPLRRIELLSFALRVPDLKAALERRGVDGEAVLNPPAPPDPKLKLMEEMAVLSRNQLSELCRRRGLDSKGNKEELVERLADALS